MPVLSMWLVGSSHDRPIRPDTSWSWVTIAHEDTPTAHEEARTLAAQMAGVRHAMVTSTVLVAVEM